VLPGAVEAAKTATDLGRLEVGASNGSLLKALF
jgi:hypothetical protein